MFQRFFVPLDGSERAEKAIPVAARLAREAAGLVTLARVIVPDADAEEYGAMPVDETTRVAARARTYLDDLLARYSKELDGLHIVLETAPGTLPSTLLDLSSQEHSDLIVMCSRGENWLKRWVFGSVTQATFRRSPIPVLVINESHATCLDVRHWRVLVPLDGSELAEAALQPLFQLLATVSAPQPHQIHLFQVISIPPATGRFSISAHLTDTLQREERASVQQSLEALARRLSDSNPVASQCVITTSVVISPDIAGAILKQAEPAEHGEEERATYDLIALATHGRTGFKRAMLGSIAEHVFGATAQPLLIVSPSMTATQEQAKPELRGETAPNWVGLL
ncbi:MAG TPA: universal stress protein [Ktedonobacteraceae bacterium]|jgi:nucleotide-binding universal stress UspA family protein